MAAAAAAGGGGGRRRRGGEGRGDRDAHRKSASGIFLKVVNSRRSVAALSNPDV